MTSVPDLESWERAYREFETPQQEIRKFNRRLNIMGVATWDRNLTIAEVFCGRGSALIVWETLGFRQLIGIDLSNRLLADYKGRARCIVADARAIPLLNRSVDVVSVQGGLHHLQSVEDIRVVLDEFRRILKPHGRVLLIEPWLTPFLRFVHFLCEQRWVRRVSPKLRSLGIMIDHERPAYERWLANSEYILSLLTKHFEPVRCERKWGKLMYLGTSRDVGHQQGLPTLDTPVS